ncbi:etoposide-induced protein 2.4-domain-containing protein [Sporodiniella umbellata]|nr:etoposide-induced protein 2.4-domain-containing protein [Sporodiniella umbellata]
MATLEKSSVQKHWSYFLSGLEDASSWPKTFLLLYSSKSIQKALFATLMLNGVLFLGGQMVLEAYPGSLLGFSYLHLLGFPVYIWLLTVNGRYFGTIADKSYQIQRSQQQKAAANPVENVASGIFTTILYINCGVTGALLGNVPGIGMGLSFLMNCFISSYYCFEFKWIYLAWNIEQRLSFMEKHWSFFLGFGCPMTLMTFFLSFLRSCAIFNIIYPFFIIMAILAAPKASTQQHVASGVNARSEWTLPNKLPVFYPVRKLNEWVIFVVQVVSGIRVAREAKETVKKDQ